MFGEVSFVLSIMFVLLLLTLFVKSCGSISCDNEYECASSTLNDTSTFCQGFASCIYAQTIVTSVTFASHGSYSAYGAKNVVSADRSICYSESSCRNISYFQINGTTYCEGYRSCFGTTFERTNETNSYANIYFGGDESGAFTTLNLSQNTTLQYLVRNSQKIFFWNFFCHAALFTYLLY